MRSTSKNAPGEADLHTGWHDERGLVCCGDRNCRGACSPSAPCQSCGGNTRRLKDGDLVCWECCLVQSEAPDPIILATYPCPSCSRSVVSALDPAHEPDCCLKRGAIACAPPSGLNSVARGRPASIVISNNGLDADAVVVFGLPPRLCAVCDEPEIDFELEDGLCPPCRGTCDFCEQPTGTLGKCLPCESAVRAEAANGDALAPSDRIEEGPALAPIPACDFEDCNNVPSEVRGQMCYCLIHAAEHDANMRGRSSGSVAVDTALARYWAQVDRQSANLKPWDVIERVSPLPTSGYDQIQAMIKAESAAIRGAK